MHCARDGRQALALAGTVDGPIDVVVSDVVLPGMGRLAELVERLAETRPGLRVLFVSGYGDDSLLERGVERDRSAFLPKPFSPAQLGRAIRRLLAAT